MEVVKGEMVDPVFALYVGMIRSLKIKRGECLIALSNILLLTPSNYTYTGSLQLIMRRLLNLRKQILIILLRLRTTQILRQLLLWRVLRLTLMALVQLHLRVLRLT